MVVLHAMLVEEGEQILFLLATCPRPKIKEKTGKKAVKAMKAIPMKAAKRAMKARKQLLQAKMAVLEATQHLQSEGQETGSLFRCELWKGTPREGTKYEP